jgi:hypothetical protein
VSLPSADRRHGLLLKGGQHSHVWRSPKAPGSAAARGRPRRFRGGAGSFPAGGSRLGNAGGWRAAPLLDPRRQAGGRDVANGGILRLAAGRSYLGASSWAMLSPIAGRDGRMQRGARWQP